MKDSTHDYPKPSVTADVLLFTVLDNELNILLIKRNVDPFKGSWALPGGFVQIDESLEDAAIITVTYLALADSSSWDLKSSGDAKEAKLFPLKSLPKLAFDHKKIVDYGLERLRSKIGYSNIVLGLLPDVFTLTDLQTKHEVILGNKLDKRNFRKKILATGLLLPTGQKSDGKAHRPAAYYKFKNRKLIITD